MQTLGTKLSKLRANHNLSQIEIAEALGVSQTTYGCWESDEYSPRKENLLKISQYYNINLNELIDDNEKISVINNDNNNNNNFISNNTVNVQQSPEIIELLQKTQEQISKNQEQNAQLIEIQVKLIELMNKKN